MTWDKPSLTGIERLNFQRFAWDAAMFVRVNAVYEEFVKRRRWQSADYAAKKIDELLATWEPTTPIN
jgi:hypothetical protein